MAVYLGLVVLVVDAYCDPWIKQWGSHSKWALGVFFLLLVGFFTWTVVWVPAPVIIKAVMDPSTYPTGSKQFGIPWSVKFSKLHIIIDNQTSMPYEDVDILIKPDAPIVGISQESTIPDISFIKNTNTDYFIPGTLFTKSGKKEGVEYSMLAFDGGYRVRCAKLPKDGLLQIIIAIGRPTGKIGFHGSEGTGANYWYKSSIDNEENLDNYFEAQTFPKMVEIEGEYIAARRIREIKLSLVPHDILKNFKVP